MGKHRIRAGPVAHCPATGKIAHPDRLAALAHLSLMDAYAAQSWGRHIAQGREYRCPLCGAWHVTTQEQDGTEEET